MARQTSTDNYRLEIGAGLDRRISSLDTETDASDIDLSGTERSRDRDVTSSIHPPSLFHRVKDERSILALAASRSTLFAGTQGGEILVWSLETYRLLSRIVGHRGAVLGLCLSKDGALLFSCAGDAIVNVWNTETLDRVYSIYSTYDVGDVFCAVYSTRLETVFLGAQNTSVQWYNLSQRHSRPTPDLHRHPSYRDHRFFDSKGPGGVSTPRPNDAEDFVDQGGQILEIDKLSIIQYAHFGYLYCMTLCQGLNQDPEEETLVTGGGDGTIKLWNLAGSSKRVVEEKATLENGDNSVLSIAMNGTLLYAGRLEGEVDVWDLESCQLIRTFKAYETDVLTLTIANGLVFTGGANGKAKLFERYKCKNEWKAHDELILASTVISYNEKSYLITGGNDDCVAIWELAGSFSSSARSQKPSTEQLVQSLGRFISYKTVSSKPEYAEDCHQGASWLRQLFKRFGGSTEMLKTGEGRKPVVLARFRGRMRKGKRILFYGHYDVIPADSEQSKWMTSPFSMEGRDGYLYGRGVSDNKGPVLAALYAVADLIATRNLESDVTFLIEGEEECGSRGFEETVKKHKDTIGPIDWILLANSYWLTDEVPCLTYGLRGAIHAKISVEGGQKDLHSGVNGSYLMKEPLKDLVTLMATLTAPDGRVAIPQFYDDILVVSDAEEGRYKTISEFLVQNGSEHGETESLKARWAEPSLTMHGFKTSGSGNTTIIPHQASISISFRLVPNQSAAGIQKTLIEYLKARWKSIETPNKLSITIDHSAEPWLGDPENDLYRTLQEAIINVWGLSHEPNTAQPLQDIGPRPKQQKQQDNKTKISGQRKEERRARQGYKGAGKRDSNISNTVHILQEPLYIREGGSIPIIRFLETEFGAPAAQLPCGQSSDNAHLDNERLRLLNLYNSRKIFREVFGELESR